MPEQDIREKKAAFFQAAFAHNSYRTTRAGPFLRARSQAHFHSMMGDKFSEPESFLEFWQRTENLFNDHYKIDSPPLPETDLLSEKLKLIKTEEYNAAIRIEGWCLSGILDSPYIITSSNFTKFTYDRDAWIYVYGRAEGGSVVHRTALECVYLGGLEWRSMSDDIRRAILNGTLESDAVLCEIEREHMEARWKVHDSF